MTGPLIVWCAIFQCMTNYLFIFRVALLLGERREASQANSRNEVCIREILVLCKNTRYCEYLDSL